MSSLKEIKDLNWRFPSNLEQMISIKAKINDYLSQQSTKIDNIQANIKFANKLYAQKLEQYDRQTSEQKLTEDLAHLAPFITSEWTSVYDLANYAGLDEKRVLAVVNILAFSDMILLHDLNSEFRICAITKIVRRPNENWDDLTSVI